MTRCVNIDWLEVYCLEPATRALDAEYFRGAGYMVEERAYGTRVYNQMFTLLGTDYFHLLEIRREPVSSVLEPNACHIRLANRTCYYTDAVSQLRIFLAHHGYTFRRIARIDICLDFERFDSGDYPDNFVRRYILGRYAKINQSNLRAHGKDRWNERNWNSVAWGSPTSAISTKLYNKSMELAEVKDKPYIRQAWFAAGLVDDLLNMTKKAADGAIYKPDIWRLEFSIRSDVKNWVVIEPDGNEKKKRSLRNTLQMYDTRDKMLAMFASLVEHYFHFRIYEEGVSKYKCQRKALFNFSSIDTYYSVERVATPIKPDAELQSLLHKLRAYRNQHADQQLRDAAATLIKALEDEDLARCCSNTFRRDELRALQIAIRQRLEGDTRDPVTIVAEVKQLLTECELFI